MDERSVRWEYQTRILDVLDENGVETIDDQGLARAGATGWELAALVILPGGAAYPARARALCVFKRRRWVER